MKTITAITLALISTGCYDIGIKANECQDSTVDELAKIDVSAAASSSESAASENGNDDGDPDDGNNGNGDSKNAGEEKSHKNGSRLKRRGFSAVDGSYQFTGWYDSELEVDCDFHQTDEGAFHCLEKAPVSAYPWNYADSDCTVRVIEEHSGLAGASMTQAERVLYPSMTAVTENFEIVGDIEITGNFYTVHTETGECINTNMGISWPGATYLEIAPVDPSIYVAAAETID